MNTLLKMTEEFTNDTDMEFGIKKCKMLHVEKGKHKHYDATETLNNEILRNMKVGED